MPGTLRHAALNPQPFGGTAVMAEEPGEARTILDYIVAQGTDG